MDRARGCRYSHTYACVHTYSIIRVYFYIDCILYIIIRLPLINSNATQQSLFFFSLFMYITSFSNKYLTHIIFNIFNYSINPSLLDKPLVLLLFPPSLKDTFFSSLRLWQPATGHHFKQSTWTMHVLMLRWMSP